MDIYELVVGDVGDVRNPRPIDTPTMDYIKKMAGRMSDDLHALERLGRAYGAPTAVRDRLMDADNAVVVILGHIEKKGKGK